MGPKRQVHVAGLWDRMFTVNGEFLGLHSWHSGNRYLVLSQESSRIVYRQYWQMLSPAQPGHKNRSHL